MRELNFFSPQRRVLRKAFRDSVLRKRVSGASASPTVGVHLLDKLTNEEILKRSPSARKFVRRPTANLPRPHYLVLKNGVVPLADFSQLAPSIFDESRRPTETAHVVPQEGRKGKKPIEWATKFEHEEEPKKLVNSEKTKMGQICSTNPLSSNLPKSASTLISILREKAIVYGQTGVDPDLLYQVRLAVDKGVEKSTRFTQLEDFFKKIPTISALIAANQANQFGFNSLIRSLGYRKKWDEALAVCRSMNELGYPLDSAPFVSLIMYAKTAADARLVFLEMRSNSVPACAKIYGALINSHVREGDLVSGFALLRKMEDEQIAHTSPAIFAILLHGLVCAGKSELAFSQFSNFRTWKQMKPDTVVFSVMIRACGDQCERALAYFEDMKQSGEFPTDVTYQHLIECMSLRPDFSDKAFEFWNLAQLEGYPMTKKIAQSLIRASAGNVPLLVKTMGQITTQNVPLTVYMYSLAISGLGGETDFERLTALRLAWHLVADVRNKGLPTTQSLLNAVTRVYAKCDPENALDMLREFDNYSLSPNKQTFEIFLQLFANQNNTHKFFQVFDDLCQKKVDSRYMHLALDMAMESKSSKRTLAVLERMLESGVPPLPETAARLAKVARGIVQIHQVVGKFVALGRETVHTKTATTQQLIELDIEEHRTRLAAVGQLESDPSVEQEARDLYFKKQTYSNPRLAKKEHLEVKKKGGPTHAQRIDKPKHNILVDM